MSFEKQQALIDRASRARAEALAALIVSAARGLHDQGRRLWRAWAAMRTRAELHALSDRTLRDIGLSRSEIDSLIR